MTEKIAVAARKVAHSDTEIIPVTSSQGPPSIQGYYDVAACLSGLNLVKSDVPRILMQL